MEVTRRLAQHIVNSKPSDIPETVRHEVSRALLNWMGCAVGAARHPTVDNALAALLPFVGPPQAGIVGRSERVDILHAALLNGVSSHVFDFDDTHVVAVHPSAPVFPALLALSEWRAMSGAELVHAFVLGVETEVRVGLSVFPEHYSVGWHITGTAGVFGAAAAAGKLLALSEQQMVWALGIAATQSSGLREMFGSMCKSLHPGKAAQNGLSAALMASKNFTSSEQGIEGPRGFANVMSTKFDSSIITDSWGAPYELMSNMYKPFACGLVMHGAIDGCIQLRDEHRLVPSMIERVDIKVGPLVLELTAKPNPQTGLEGKFSVFHAAAVALIYGQAGEAQFSDACVQDPAVIAIRTKVHIEPDPTIGRTQAHVSIVLTDGRALERHVADALGTLARPMSDADLEAKFRALSANVLSDQQCDEVIRLCWSVDTLPDVSTLVRAATVTHD
jgi:2-methylcitrate dehydratase PrpD